jgi:hypothetical protein
MGRITYEYTPKDLEYMRSTSVCNIKHYPDKLEACRAIGCESWVEGVRESYRRTKSLSKAGELLGVTDQCILHHLTVMGIKRGPKGGYNRPPAKTFEGQLCPVCGTTTKYANRGICRECNLQASKDWRDRQNSLK